MGFFNRNVFIDIIEWVPTDDSIVVHKHDRHDNEIKNGAKLIVRESQVAVIVEQGQFADVFGPGTHELSTENLPILSDLRGWKHGFDSAFVTEVYYLDTGTISGLAWGTGSFDLYDTKVEGRPYIGSATFTAYGTYNAEIVDPKLVLKKVSKLDTKFTVEELDAFLTEAGRLSSVVKNVATNDVAVPLGMMSGQLDNIGRKCNEVVNGDLEQYGIKVVNFQISDMPMDEADSARLDEMSRLGAADHNMGSRYSEFQTGQAINQPGSDMNEGMSTGMGMAMAMGAMNQMTNQPQQQSGQTPPPTSQGGTPPPPPGATPAVAVHVMIGDQQYGPYNTDQLKQYLDEGRINAGSMAWMEGMASWGALNAIPQLSSLFSSAGGPPPPPPPM